MFTQYTKESQLHFSCLPYAAISTTAYAVMLGLSSAGEPGKMTYEIWNDVPGSEVSNFKKLLDIINNFDEVSLTTS